jgi:LysM repeat protein
MSHRIALTTVLLALASPVSLAASEVETLRTRCAEQERQIRELEEENSRLRQLNGVNSKFANRPAPAADSPQPEVANGTPASPDTPPAPAKYTVRKGDSWERVARKFDTRPDKLAALNDAKSTDMLREGQQLKVPSAGSGTTPPPTASQPAPAAGSGIHQVKQGETYYSIGKKLGISAEKLQAANPTIKATALRPGLTIKTGQANSAPSGGRPANTQALPNPSASQPAPAPPPPPARNPAPTGQAPRSSPKPVMINDTITVGEFAAKHGTTVARLNSLNNLDLVESTVLAVGSELYVPAQP